MERYEARVLQAVAGAPESRELLGALGVVVNSEGTVVYKHAAGHQSLAPDAPALDGDSIVALGSAGKFITHIAALQCVEQGLIGLDDPVYGPIPELDGSEIISKNDGPDAETKPFLLRPAANKITLRHLLCHASGQTSPDSHPLLREWRKVAEPPKEDADIIIKLFCAPLIFEPGEAWEYGPSVAFTSLLISRLTGKTMPKFCEENIFKPLGMTSSTFTQDREDLRARFLQTVSREDGKLVPDDGAVQGLACSMSDITRILADLLAPTSKILSKENVDLLFAPQFAPGSGALAGFRADTETYAAPAGIPDTMKTPPVNWSVIGGMLVEGELPISCLPQGTLTWNGMPNVVWAINRERGIATVFATQLLPVDDEKAVEVMMEFLRGVWNGF